MTEVPTKEKLAKLLRLLSSEIDGEVLSAVRAIERTLKANGKSFHDLADAIVDKVIVFEIEKVIEGNHLAKNYIDAAEWLLKQSLKPHEADFVRDMKRRFEFSADFTPTQKQSGWFTILVKKHSGEAIWQQPKTTSGMGPVDPETPPF